MVFLTLDHVKAVIFSFRVRVNPTTACACQALEVVELRDRVADEAESARELRAKLAAAQAIVHRLEDQNLGLEERLVQMRGWGRQVQGLGFKVPFVRHCWRRMRACGLPDLACHTIA